MIIDFHDTLFSAAFHIATRKKRRLIKKNFRHFYADKNDYREMERAYARWKISGVTLGEYFNAQIVICNEITRADLTYSQGGDNLPYRLTIKKFDLRPIFIGVGRKRHHVDNNPYHVIKLKQVESVRPIQMSEKLIADLYGLPTNFTHLIDLYNNYDVKFKFLHVELNPKRVKDGRYVTESLDVPGERLFADNCKEIRVGRSTKGITYWIPSSIKVGKQIYCRKNPDLCWYSDHREAVVRKHESTCQSEPVVKSKEKVYGLSRTILDDLADQNMIPDSLRNYHHSYLATFDIETLEQPVEERRTDLLTTNSHHNLVSIGVSTNIPGFTDRWFCRRSSDEKDGTKCVNLFVKYLQTLQSALEQLLPVELLAAIEKLQMQVNAMFDKQKLFQLNNLKKFKQLNVYGFNSGKSDYYQSR